MPRIAPRGWLLTLAIALAATGAGCSRSLPPAPVDQRGQAAAQQVPLRGGGTVIVQPGETVYAVARRNQIPLKALIDANSLQPPYHLVPGQSLAVPRVRTHQVQGGDTVYAVARRYGVSANELVRANGIEPPFVIRVGQLLILPGPIEPAPTEVAAVPPAPAPAPIMAPPAPAPVTTQPARGIEQAPLSPPPAEASPPPVAAPSTTPRASPPGLATQLPPATTPPAAPPEAVPPTPPPAAQAPPRPEIAAPAAPAAPPPAEPPQREARAPVGDPPPRAGRLFLWPVRGAVLSDFGPKTGGLHNDGVNIAAPRGTPIRAAENGVVVYAGNELRGFGNLLLLRHDGGWMTAYGHAEDLSVRRGDRVRRGQVIGRVGSTGNVNSPQLHFEIRRGNRAVNPREFLAPGDRA